MFEFFDFGKIIQRFCSSKKNLCVRPTRFRAPKGARDFTPPPPWCGGGVSDATCLAVGAWAAAAASQKNVFGNSRKKTWRCQAVAAEEGNKHLAPLGHILIA